MSEIRGYFLMERESKTEVIRLDLDSMIVFGTDPIHPARHFAILHDFGCHHRSSALGALMPVNRPFVAEARTGRL